MSVRNLRSHSESGRISNETLSIWLLSTVLVLGYIVPPEITSVIVFAVVLILILLKSGAIDAKTASVLKPLFGLVLLGSIYGFANDPIDITRDVWLIAKAVTCVLLGYLLACRVKRIPRLLKQFAFVSVLLSLVYIVPYLLGVRDFGIGLSGDSAALPLVTVLALPLLLMRSNGLVQFGSRHFRLFAVATILLANGLSLSRTAVGCVVIMMLAAIGVFDKLRRFLIFGVVLVFMAFFVAQQLPSIETGGVTFASKTRNALSELAFTDGTDPSEMLTNWRGFEAYRAFSEFAESTLLQQLVGRGLGATVDLGMTVQMSENMSYQFIPHLHNGYMHVLTKHGVLGVLLYLLFLRRISRQPLTNPPVTGQIATRRILIGISLVLVYTTLVVTGIFNKGNHDSFLIMMGVFFRIAHNLTRSVDRELMPVSSQTPLRSSENAF